MSLKHFITDEARAFLKKAPPNCVFGVGVDIDQKGDVDCVKFIVRTKMWSDKFKKFFSKEKSDLAMWNLFSTYPASIEENPDDGLHGNVYACKITRNGSCDYAMYRRIWGGPVSFESGSLFFYKYSDFYAAKISKANPNLNEGLFKIEEKVSIGGASKAICIYPKYSSLKFKYSSMQFGLEDQYRNLSVHDSVQSMAFNFASNSDLLKDMTLVSYGESKDKIKFYFVDFTRSKLAHLIESE